MKFTTMRYYLYEKKLFLTLFFAASCLLWGGCSQEESYPEEMEKSTSGNVFLSFAVRTTTNEDTSPTHTNSRGITNDIIQTGEKEGTALEQRINNLWVLLYTKGNNDPTSILKYKFSFTLNGPDNQYIDSSGKIIGTLTSQGIYYTSAKLVEPGTYRIVVIANTKIKFVNHSAYPMPNDVMKNISNQELDIMTDLCIPGRYGIESFYALTQNTNQFTGINIGEEIPFNDKSLTDNGILAYYTNDNFVIDEIYNTPKTPIIHPMGLKRWLSKVRMTITNQDVAGKVYPDAAGYKLKSVQLMNYYTSNKFFEWDNHGYGSYTGFNSFNLIGLPAFEKDKFPLLHQLYTNGFIANTSVPEAELFNHYITGYNNALLAETENNYQFVRLIVTQTSTGRNFQYDIPIYNEENVQRPSYISATKFSKYTILRNTLYELRIIFKGPSLGVIGLTYEVKDYTPVQIDIPSFE